jgi:GT2 family glycosyltransferase
VYNLLTAIIVLYNKNIESSETISSIVKCDSSTLLDNVLVWDNSPLALKDDELEECDNKFNEKNIRFNYRHCPENYPLSKVYNHFFINFKDSDYFLILDDDTLLNSDFFDCLSTELRSNSNSDLYIPRIYHRSKLISPSKRFLMKGWYLNGKPKGELRTHFLSAINSCMVISNNFLIRTGFKYDERLTSYGTDDEFILSFNKKRGSCKVLDVDIHHDLSLSTMNNNSLTLKLRYTTLIESWMILYSKGVISKICIRLYALLHASYMTGKYKDVSYFHNVFKVITKHV